jgi:hypothetical protein
MLNVIFTIPRKYTLLVGRLKVNRRTYNFVSRADLTGCEVSYCFILLTLQADPLAPIRWSRYNSDKRETYNPPASRNMTTNNRTKAAAAGFPDPNDGELLLDLAEMLSLAMKAKAATKADRRSITGAPVTIAWTPSTIAAACALPIPMELPSRYPVRGPGAQMKDGPAFVAAPKDLEAINGPVCPPRRHDPLLNVIRAALLNDWAGMPLHRGESAAEGGLLPLSVLLTVLQTQPNQQKARKWGQVLTGSGQTNLLAQVANVSGRFAILRPEGIVLVRDFYAAAT